VLEPIRRRFGPEDLEPELAAAEVERTILVQTRSSLVETREFLATAATTDFIAGHPELLEEMKKFEGDVSPMDYSAADPRKIAAAAAAVAALTTR